MCEIALCMCAHVVMLRCAIPSLCLVDEIHDDGVYFITSLEQHKELTHQFVFIAARLLRLVVIHR